MEILWTNASAAQCTCLEIDPELQVNEWMKNSLHAEWPKVHNTE